jgi:recombinational DNA repair protein (RecF pathway)
MVVGYLVPHHCDKPALGKCQRCQRRFCEEHLSVQEAGLVCVACQQGLPQPVVIADDAAAFDAADRAAFGAAQGADDASDTFSDLS